VSLPSFGYPQASIFSLASAANASSEMHSDDLLSIHINRMIEGADERETRRRVKTSVGPESSSRDLPSPTMSSWLFDFGSLLSRQSRGPSFLLSTVAEPEEPKMVLPGWE